MDDERQEHGRRWPNQVEEARIDVHVHHKIDLHIHDGRSGGQAILQDILKGIVGLQKSGVILMGKVDDQRIALERANVATNEIAADVRELITKAADGGLTQADVDRGIALADRLEAVAAEYTADVPTTGEGEPGGPVNPPVG